VIGRWRKIDRDRVRYGSQLFEEAGACGCPGRRDFLLFPALLGVVEIMEIHGESWQRRGKVAVKGDGRRDA